MAIKDHVFFDEHPLTDDETSGVMMSRYDPGPDQVDIWQRLVDGDPSSTDLLWLDHMYAEMKYDETHPGASYAEAHEAANQVANWAKAVGLE